VEKEIAEKEGMKNAQFKTLARRKKLQKQRKKE